MHDWTLKEFGSLALSIAASASMPDREHAGNWSNSPGIRSGSFHHVLTDIPRHQLVCLACQQFACPLAALVGDESGLIDHPAPAQPSAVLAGERSEFETIRKVGDQLFSFRAHAVHAVHDAAVDVHAHQVTSLFPCG